MFSIIQKLMFVVMALPALILGTTILAIEFFVAKGRCIKHSLFDVECIEKSVSDYLNVMYHYEVRKWILVLFLIYLVLQIGIYIFRKLATKNEEKKQPLRIRR